MKYIAIISSNTVFRMFCEGCKQKYMGVAFAHIKKAEEARGFRFHGYMDLRDNGFIGNEVVEAVKSRCV